MELAADRPACDAFAHVNIAEVTTEAETSATPAAAEPAADLSLDDDLPEIDLGGD